MFRGMLLGVICTVLWAAGAGAAEFTLRLGHVGEPESPYGQGADKFAALVQEKTGEAVEIEVFPSSQLGNQKDLIKGIMDGSVDMVLTSSTVFASVVPAMGAFDLPFVFRDEEHAYRALDSVGMEVAKAAEAKGVKTLCIMENGVRHITNNKLPIKSPNDMKGLKIRTTDQPVHVEMLSALGAVPVSMPLGEVHEALEGGGIDGQENTLAYIYIRRIFDVQKYISLTGHVYSAEPLLINLAAWNKLPARHQKALQEAALEARDWQRELCRDLEDEYIKKIEESEKSVVNDDVDKKAFAEATRDTWKLFAGKVKGGQAVIDKIVSTK